MLQDCVQDKTHWNYVLKQLLPTKILKGTTMQVKYFRQHYRTKLTWEFNPIKFENLMYLSSILILRGIACDLVHIYPNSSVFDDCRFLNNIL